jgi:DNA-binding MarR family transcriptional regulator
MTEARRSGNGREPAVRFGKLPGYIGYQVRQAQTAVFRDISRTIKSIGATPGEFSLLALLAVNPGINSMTLARIYQLDKATLSLAVKSLVARGFISSTRNTNDRRYYSLSLTPAGRAKLRRLTRLVEKQERVMDGVLKKGERALLLDMLERIARAFGT